MFKLINQFKGLKKECYIFFIGRFVTSLGGFVWPMLTFFMTTKLNLSDSHAALILACGVLGALPATYLGGKLADHFSKKWTIIIFDCVSFVMYLLAGLIEFSFITVILCFFAAIAQNLEGPSYDALVADFSTTEDREKACTLNYLGINIGVIAGSSISGLLFVSATRLAFILNGVAIIISTILIFFFVDMKDIIDHSQEVLDTPQSIYEDPVDDKISAVKILLKRYSVPIMMLILIFSWVPANINAILLPLKLKSIHGVEGATLYGYLTSFNGLTVILFTPLVSLLAKNISEIPKSLVGTAFYILGLIIFMSTENTIVLFAGMLVFTWGEICLVVGSSPYVSRRIPLSHRGRVNGLLSVVQTLIISGLEFLVSGMLIWTNSNYSTCWLIFVIFGIIVLILGIINFKNDKKLFPLLYSKDNSKK